MPNGDILEYDFDRDITRRMTVTEADDDMPVASPDGRWVAYTSAPRIAGERAADRYSILLAPRDGSGRTRELYRVARDAWPLDWSDDGRLLLVGVGNFSILRADSIGIIEVNDPTRVRWLAVAPGTAAYANFSHDGRWIAYDTGITLDPQIYLVPTPGADRPAAAGEVARIQVSSRGGIIPRWRGDDREIYFSRPDGMIVAVPLAPGTLQPGRETELFRAVLRPAFDAFDASRDGQRFVINTLASEGAAPIVLVSGWKQELKPR
jgi:Tol biopolymer transport system component